MAKFDAKVLEFFEQKQLEKKVRDLELSAYEVIHAAENEHKWKRAVDYHGVVYSKDKKVLISDIPFNQRAYAIKKGTKIVMGKRSNNLTPDLVFLFMPDSVEFIASKAFYSYKNLSSVIFSRKLLIIEDDSFSDCKFHNIILPPGLLKIGKYAFKDNPVLESLFIPESVVEIGEGFVDNCPNLSRIFIPQSNNKSLKKQIVSRVTKRFAFIEIKYPDWESDIEAKFEREDSRIGPVPFYEDTSDRANYDAMTDGMYGDYPDEGYDGDFESIGY